MNFAIGWRQVAAVFYLLALGTGIIFSSYGIISTPIGKEFEASHTVVMMGIGAILFVGATMSPIVGGWIDRYPFRNLAAAAALLIAAGLVALSFAQAMWQVIAIYALFMAIPAVICSPMGGSVLLMRWFVQRRGRAMGIAIIGLSAGSFVFPFLIQLLIEGFGWRGALQVLALFTVVTMLPVALFVIVNRPSDRGYFADGASEPPPETPSTREVGKKLSLREVAGDRNFWLVSLALGFPLSAGTGTVSNVVLLADDVGIKASVAALVMSTIAVSGALGKLTFAAVADRFDCRATLVAGMLLMAASTVVLAFAGSAVSLFLGGALIAYGSGLLNPLWGVIFPRTFDQAIVGRIMGLATSLGMILSVIAPILIGRLRDVTGTYEVPFLLYGSGIVLVAVLVRWIRLRPAQ